MFQKEGTMWTKVLGQLEALFTEATDSQPMELQQGEKPETKLLRSAGPSTILVYILLYIFVYILEREEGRKTERQKH